MTCILLTPSDSFTFPLTCLAKKKHFATCEDDVLALTYRGNSHRDALYEFADRIENKLESEHIAGNLCRGLVAGIYGKNAIDPVANKTFGSIVAGLILIFPEIRWYFLDVEGLPSIFDEPGPDQKQRSLFSPLFDADGIRSELIGKATARSVESQIPDCVVVEDELNFCFYYSYVAYRSGYRVLPITSYAAFNNIKTWFPKDEDSPTVLIEDMSLGFFDREGEESLIKLEDRDKNNCYETISREARLRALVTIGQIGDYRDSLTANKNYLKDCCQRDEVYANMKCDPQKKYFAEAAKPVGGMFRLVESLELKNFTYSDDKEHKKEGSSGNHSAPGMVQAIVEVMLSRVRRRRDREGLLDILLGCVLSIDALKLLDDKAPMLKFDALFSQHENEVRAESKFIDIGPVKDVKQRLKEIAKKIEEIAAMCQKENQRGVELQAQATLAHRMMLVFRSAAQYDEEIECLNYLRKAQRRLKRLTSPTRGSLKRFVNQIRPLDLVRGIVRPPTWGSLKLLPRTYAELLVSGGYWRPIIAMVVWLLILSGSLWVEGGDFSMDSLVSSWKRVASGFFEAAAVPEEAVAVLESSKKEGGSWKLFKPIGYGLLVVLIGVFHIGVFISFVSSRLMRR